MPQSKNRKITATANHRELSTAEMSLVLLVTQIPVSNCESRDVRKARREARRAYESSISLNSHGFTAHLDAFVWLILSLEGLIK